jgi:peptide/nickel transport system ATP-binding protein
MPPVPEPVLEVSGLSKTCRQGHWWEKRFYRTVLRDVGFALPSGRTLGLVGKSGSGKTTLAMCLVGLVEPDEGAISLEGKNLRALGKAERVSAQRQIQLVFQDSAGALNPRMSAAEIVEEPLLVQGLGTSSERAQKAEAMMERVGISPGNKFRRAHEFSGGQRQRLGIARALVLTPKVLILDEVFTGLDVSIRAQIANLLLELQQAQGLSYICISHDLGFVSQIANRIAVLDQGLIVQQANAGDIIQNVSCPATWKKRFSAIGAKAGT